MKGNRVNNAILAAVTEAQIERKLLQVRISMLDQIIEAGSWGLIDTRKKTAASGNGAKKPSRARKLQGRYMGLLGGLNAGDRRKVKARAKKQGIEKGIALAERLRG